MFFKEIVWSLWLSILTWTAQCHLHLKYIDGRNNTQTDTDNNFIPSLVWLVHVNCNQSKARAENVARLLAKDTGLLLGGRVRGPADLFILFHDLEVASERGGTDQIEFMTSSTGHLKYSHYDFHNRTAEAVGREVFDVVQERVEQILENSAHVLSYNMELLRPRERRFHNYLYDPNPQPANPVFHDPKFHDQWHLMNTKHHGRDVNVSGVWKMGITGKGSVVCIIDDGIEYTNIDIKDSYSAISSYDVNDNDNDPLPTTKANDNYHGTRCAGEVTATPNSFCGVGVAYGAKVAGVRILDAPFTDSIEAHALTMKNEINDIYSSSWGPTDNGKTIDGPHFAAQNAFQEGVTTGRNGLGNIFIVAGGNGGMYGDNCNYDGYANSIYTVTVGAVSELLQFPYYGEECASGLAITYSGSGRKNDRSIVTTDWHLEGGTGCTNKHGGTSAAAPLAAGLVALMLSTRPCLTWRDVQHIIVVSGLGNATGDLKSHFPLHPEYVKTTRCHKVGRCGSEVYGYQKNAAGLWHSHTFGFGLMNAWRLVQISKIWDLVPPLMVVDFDTESVDETIGPNHSITLEKEVSLDDVLGKNISLRSVEYALVFLNSSHIVRGLVEIRLTSPSNTESVLATERYLDNSSKPLQWTFTTARSWGESPFGKWKLKIINKDVNNEALVVSWALSLSGSSITAPEYIAIVNRAKRIFSGEEVVGDAKFCNLTGYSQMEDSSSHDLMIITGLIVVGICFVVLLCAGIAACIGSWSRDQKKGWKKIPSQDNEALLMHSNDSEKEDDEIDTRTYNTLKDTRTRLLS